MERETGQSIRCECIIPVLAVRDVPASMRFYIDVLGFRREWGGEGADAQVGSVALDGKSIMLSRSGAPAKAQVWLGMGDVAALHERLAMRGVKIVHPPRNQPWALEMRAEDPDGNVLWFGSEPLPEKERPYET